MGNNINLPPDLEQVCLDADESVWYYDKDHDMYYRVYPQARAVKRIDGQYLPDPEAVLTKRIAIFETAGQVNVDALKCSPATIELWNHRQKLGLE